MEGFKCTHCEKEWTKDVDYVCPSCQGNLDVVYDYSSWAKKYPRSYWKDNRDFSIWRYAPFLPVSDLTKAPRLQIGWTPLYKMENPAWGKLYLKDDGRNPSASFKDRASAVALVDAREKKASRVVGASTGNAGSSMACLAASVGMPATIFVPHTAPQAKIAQLLIFGAEVIMIEGTYDEAFDLCFQIAQEYGWYNRNTGYNPYTREGKKTCAFEICEQLDWEVPDWVFVSVGDGNIISGLWKGFQDLYQCKLIDRLPKLGSVQSTLSNAITQAVEHYLTHQKIEIRPVQARTSADSISVDMPRDGVAAVKAIVASQGRAVSVTDEDILDGMKEIARNGGVFGEPAGVASFAGYKKLLRERVVGKEETAVCVITGNGLKDVQSAIKAAGKPTVVPAELEKIKKYIGK